jgi:hypothetical protein
VLVALWFTQSRGGMLAVIAAGITALVLRRDAVPRRVLAGAGAVTAVVAAVALVVVWHPGTHRPVGPLARLQVLRTESLGIRGNEWRAAVVAFAHHPVTGTGPETFYADYPRYRSRSDGARFGLLLADKPHNLYLEYAATTGVLGVAAFLFLIAVVFWRVVNIRPPPGLLVVAAATMAGWLAEVFFSIDVPPLAMTGWLAMAMVVTLSDAAVVHRRDHPQPAPHRRGPRGRPLPRRNPWPFRGLVALVTAAAIATVAQFWVADSVSHEADATRPGAGAFERAAARYERAGRLAPSEATYQRAAGFAYERAAADVGPKETKAFLGRAIERYRRANQLRRNHVPYLADQARAEALWGDRVELSGFQRSDRLYQRAVSLDPFDWQLRDQYALALNAWANAAGGDRAVRTRAGAQYRTVVGLRPDQADAWANLARVDAVLGRRDQARRELQRAIGLDPTNQSYREGLGAI